MDLMSVARGAKVVALVGFFLPWISVSCSGQELGSASGLSLAAGFLSARNPMTGMMETQSVGPVLWLVAAILVIGIGLFLSFDEDHPQNAKALTVGAGLALVLCMIGLGAVNGGAAKQANRQGGGQFAGMGQMIQVNTRSGYWLTFWSLALATGLGGVILSGREGALLAGLGDLKFPALPAAPPDGADVSFWDRMGEKTDPDLLQEYLLRFPTGRFSALARSKLERMGLEPLVPSPPQATPTEPPPAAQEPSRTAPAAPVVSVEPICARCGATLEAEAKFCTECGVARDSEA